MPVGRKHATCLFLILSPVRTIAIALSSIYNVGMKLLLRLIEITLALFFVAIIFIVVLLYRPDFFPFQPTMGQNIIVLSTALMAFGTLFLAYATFRSIAHSAEQEKRRIQHSNEQEKRDRTERLLNEIIKWATDLFQYAFGSESRLVPMVDVKMQRKADTANKLSKYQFLFAKSEGIKVIAAELQKNLSKEDINAPVSAAIGYLETAITATIKRFRNITDETTKGQLETVEQELQKAARHLIETATKLKTKGIS